MKIPGLRGLSPYGLIKQTVRYYLENDMLTYAAALAFQALFSLVPFIIVLIAMLGLFDLGYFFDWIRNQIDLFLPNQAMEQVDLLIDEVARPRADVLSVGLLIAIWTASGAMRSTINALNVVYKVREARPFYVLYPLSVLYMFGVVGMLITAALFMVLGPQIMEWLTELIGIRKLFVIVWTWLRWPVALVLLMLAVAFVYYVAPDVKQKLRFITPGSILSVIVWIAASQGFSYYIQNFADYSAVYGSIGTIIVLMMFFFISAAVLLFGAELNAVIEHHASTGKNLGDKNFMGDNTR
jgi:membrane protein